MIQFLAKFMRLYIDTNAYISLLREEVSIGRSLFAEAKSFFEKVAIQRDTIILSELIFFEIESKIHTSKEELLSILTQLSINYETCNDIKSDTKRIHLLGIHYPDCIHASTAINTNCNCIITFNTKDFEGIENEIPVLDPKNY